MQDTNIPSLTQNSDFQAVLDSLLAAYRPILERELGLSESTATLVMESQMHPSTCAKGAAAAATFIVHNKHISLALL